MSKFTEPFPPIIRVKSVYRDGTRVQVKILDARVRKLKTANKWLVDELCEPIQGGAAFWQQRGGLVSPMKPIKTYTEKYDSKANAEDTALKVRTLARAYEHGRISIQNEADLSVGGRSVVIEQTRPDGEVEYFTASSLANAIAEAERKIWSGASLEQPVSAAKFKSMPSKDRCSLPHLAAGLISTLLAPGWIHIFVKGFIWCLRRRRSIALITTQYE